MKNKQISITKSRQLEGLAYDKPNQIIMRFTDGAVALISYDSVIALKTKNYNVILGQDWDHSIITGKHRAAFLMENKKTTLEKIKSGEYKIANLIL